MSCSRCGSRCIGRLCTECAMDIRHGDAAAGTDTPDGHDEPKPYQCSRCGHEWETADPGACPDCGGYRRQRTDPLEP